jgi:DNA-binding SARP family transcriptional activator
MTGTAQPGRATARVPSARVFVLGQFRVVVDGRVLSDKAWQRPQSRRLFKFLATRRFRRVLKESAMELFWPESEPTAAATNLRSLVFGIRQALQEVGAERLLISDRDSISLDASANIWVDAETFDDLVTRARAADDPLPLLESASELCQGDFLAEDLYEDWAAERRQALHLVWEDVQFQLAQRYEQRGQQENALARLLALLLVDRCNERAGQEAMRLLIDLGRRPEALRVFNALQLALRDELGVTPAQRSLELQRLATQAPAATHSARAVRFRCAYTFPQPRELIGRAAELERVQRLLERGRSNGQAVLFSAPAGTGKSALLGAVVRSAQERGVLCLVGGSYDQRSAVPLVAFEEALTDYILSTSRDTRDSDLPSSADELVQVVRELRQHLGLDSAPNADTSNARMRLFGAILSFVRSLAERGPLVLCLEDLHAADAASLQLLHFLARQTRHSPVVIIGTFRHEALRPGEPLAQLVSGLEREGIAEHIRLAPLDRQATGKLAALLSDGPVSDRARAALHELTEGNPLFIEQVLLTLGAHGQLDDLVSVGQQIISHGANVPLVIRELIGRRLADMSPDTRATMEIAAVLGSTFDESTLLAVAAPTEEPALLGHLDEALRAHILRETPNGYAFEHALLREGVYWNLSRPRRTLLHRRAGEVLERLAQGRIAQRAAELAYHFNLAGHSADARAKAYQYSLMAGRQTQALTAYREAVGHFTRASELIGGMVDADQATRIEVLVGRGEAEEEIGRWVESLKTWQQVLAVSQDPLQRARAWANMAYAHVELGRVDDVADDVQAGLDDLRESAGAEAARFRIELMQWSAYVLHLRGRNYDVLDLGEQMLAEANVLATARPLYIAHSVVAWGCVGLGRSAQGIQHCEQVVDLAVNSGHKIQQAFARQNLGLQHYRAGHFSEAEQHFQRAREMCYESANEARALHLLQLQALVWLARGDLARAHAQATIALELSQANQVRWAADSHHILGLIATLRGQWEDAERYFKQALNVRLHIGVMDDAVQSTVGLGRVYDESGHWPRELEQYTEAVRLAREMAPGPMLVHALAHLGRLHVRRGDSSVAALLISEAVGLAETIPETLDYEPALLALAELRLHDGDPTAARGLIVKALGRELPVHYAILAHCLLARVCAVLGDGASGAEHAEQGARLADGLGSPHLAAAAALAAAQVLAAGGDARRALAGFEAAAARAEAAHASHHLARALEGQIDQLTRLGPTENIEVLHDRLAGLHDQLGLRQLGHRPLTTAAPPG